MSFQTIFWKKLRHKYVWHEMFKDKKYYQEDIKKAVKETVNKICKEMKKNFALLKAIEIMKMDWNPKTMTLTRPKREK